MTRHNYSINHKEQEGAGAALRERQEDERSVLCREKEEACKELLNTLKYKSSLVEDLESQLAKERRHFGPMLVLCCLCVLRPPFLLTNLTGQVG
jgi:hypothetical protein